MNIHLIAIGGSAMHNLAIAMHQKGYIVTGSDDEIVEPSRTRLQGLGLLPAQDGWFPEKIHPALDAVILGMHARADNPELARAKELGIPVYSYPGYIFEQSRNKTRIVIGGSHGKTSITAMILHVMHQCGKDCDYLVGAQLKGFNTMVRLTDAPVILLEGDEYLSSALEPIPKFHLYHPHIALLSGVAWDHINVFPTFDNYLEQFRIFIDKIASGGSLIYYEGDEHLVNLAKNAPSGIELLPYKEHPAKIENGRTFLIKPDGTTVQIRVFGKHNLQNINGALHVCVASGISEAEFYEHIQSFTGAARRLEVIFEKDDFTLFKDFAHSPSKLKATTEAVREQFPGRKLIACMELHTFSSLNEQFLEEYQGAMNMADEAFVYFNPHTVEHKKLKPISKEQVSAAFGRSDLRVFNHSGLMLDALKQQSWNNANLLMMSSGNFDGIQIEDLPQLLHLTQ